MNALGVRLSFLTLHPTEAGAVDDELPGIIAAWPTSPPDLRQAVLRLIKDSTIPPAPQQD
jgi:hypothetical protein